MALGETILGAVLEVVIDKLASKNVINFFRQSKFDQSLVDKLKTLMFATEKLLLDAEEKQMTDPAVKQWLEQLRHWFYRAEEVVDQIATEALQSSLEAKFASEPKSLVTKVRNWTLSLGNSSTFQNTITLDIKEIVRMLESMLNQKDALGLRELSVGKAPQRDPTSCLMEGSKVYGRDIDKEKILQYLLSEEAETTGYGVLAIVGMGGLGKTTLAKMVYNDERVQKTFHLKAWVCISDQFDISRITKSIIELVTCQTYRGPPDLSVLQTKLSGKLRDKKFLLVLDDVWNEKYDEWEVLQAPFSAGAIGSRIIVTTRSEEVASTMRSRQICPEPLSDKDAWSLFSRYAFEEVNLVSNPQLECTARKIVEKCQGLPLAIKTLGSLLCGKDDHEEWEEILQSSLWGLPYHKSNVTPALWLSYYHLPPHLKRCFSYCAIFPKDYQIDRKQLVLLWMAENVVLPTARKRRIEDVGDEQICQLVSRSFLEPVDEAHVKMHNLMHDLAEHVSGNFFARHELQGTSEVSQRTRQFSYNVGNLCDAIPKFQDVHEAKYLRTFLQLTQGCIGNCYLTAKVPTVLIPDLSLLRVLTLSGYVNLILPESIGCLKQLRYLDVSHSGIKQLPESATNLYNLQTLVLSYCKQLAKLPTDMWRLGSLRHLDIRGGSSLSYMPNQMSKLKSLQTLTDFVVGKNVGSGIQELRELQEIRGKFALRRLQNINVPSDAYAVDLRMRSFIDDLELEFDPKERDNSEKDREVLEILKPSSNVKRLTIRNYAGTRFPSWLDLGCEVYGDITFLCLVKCQYCYSLPPLGQLPSLKELNIEGMDYVIEVGHEFYGHGICSPFPSLEHLSFKNMKGWKVWSSVGAEDGEVCFHHLKKLSIRDCPNLKGNLPLHVPSLMELEIDGCVQLSQSLPQAPSAHVLELAALPNAEVANVCRITKLRLKGLLQLVNLPSEVVMLSSLRHLFIQSCDNLMSLTNVNLPPKLETLRIEGCKVLESLPGHMVCLRHLHVCKCPRLRCAPGDSLPTSLGSLRVFDCERWEFPISIEKMQLYTSLDFLYLRRTADNLVSFPLGSFPILRVLVLWGCKGLEKVYIPEGPVINSLTSLSFMHIGVCPKLKMVGKKTGSGGATVLPAPNLTSLRIAWCENVTPLLIETEEEVLLPKLDLLSIMIPSQCSPSRSLLRFSCLRVLALYDQHVEQFPDGGLGSLPASLTEVEINDFPKLRTLDGRALQRLTCIQRLWINDCPHLQCLPREGLPPSLGLLSIQDCPLVEKRCQPNKGQDWFIIHHLPLVLINELILVPDTDGVTDPYTGPIGVEYWVQ